MKSRFLPARGRIVRTSGHLFASLFLLAWSGCERHTGHDHDHGHHDHRDHDEEAGHGRESEVAKGPHGGRLLTDGGFSLEVGIFESGVPPEFRVHASEGGVAIEPGALEVAIELRRLGGRRDKHTFRPGDGFLVGQQEVYEPHSFTAMVIAVHAGQTHRWEYDSVEARTTITAEAAEQSGLRVESVGGARIQSVVKLPGEVRFNEEHVAVVPARFEGRVTEVRKSVGDRAEAGETLAVIESRELADARADYIDTVHRLELAQSVFVREEGLREKRIGVEQDYLKARHEMEEMEIRKQTARQKLLALGIDGTELEALAMEPAGKVVTFKVRQPFAAGALSRFNLTAPLGGAVVARSVAAGQIVSADDVLFEVADLSSVWVDLALFPRQSAGVTVGCDVNVRAGEARATGRIAYLSAFVAEPSRAITARVLLPNPEGRWRPGQFVEGEVRIAEVPVPVAVRVEALQTFREWQVVFVNEGDQYEPVVVETGRRDDGWVEIRSGLEPGQRYVTAGSYVVKADILKSSAAHDHDH